MAALLCGQVLERVRLRSAFLLRSVEPPLAALHGRQVQACRRMGKRLVLRLEGQLHLVLHLMIAGRLRRKAAGAGILGKVGLAAFDFSQGTLMLTEWTERLRAEVGSGFPDKVTAFRPELEVHGRFGKPCPTCGQPVQRSVYAENECNDCAGCQTGGRLPADRALSRLLKDDWPATLEGLEALRRR